MKPKRALTIGYIGVKILAVLIGSPAVAPMIIEFDTNIKTYDVGPWTLEDLDRMHSKKKRNVDCRGLECRSLCPWRLVQDTQEGRNPRSISRAQCVSRSCDFGFDGLGRLIKSVLQFYTECEPVYTTIKVWQDGLPEWIHWPIACACSRVRSRTETSFGDVFKISDLNRHKSSTTGSLILI